ncbi:MAG: hypothetical protein GXP48_02270 [Acidobacteria bacterium]|nr:hypothetical protein [Acidobacteriota bacterium]
MRKHTLMAMILLLAGAAGVNAAAGERVISGTYPAKGLEGIELNVAVGDARITVGKPGIIEFHVRLTPRRGGVFSSMAEARKQVDAARLDMTPAGKTLKLSIQSNGQNPKFEATWSISIPARLGVSVRTGVGDVMIRGVTGAVKVKDGVGDVTVTTHGSHVTVDTGVGDVTIRGDLARFGRITGAAGVGDATLTTPNTTIDGSGMVGKRLSWTGPGPGVMRIKAGVGDVEISLVVSPH